MNTLCDDRGAGVTYRDPMYCGSELDRSEREQINRRRDSTRYVMMAVIPILLIIQVISLLQSSLPTILFKLAFVAMFTAIAWWLVVPGIRRAMWSRHWKDRYKELEKCPACQYSLTALPSEPDGCTVCPECGAAWRLDRQVH